MKLQTTDLTPRIGTEIEADADSLLSGMHAQQIRELLARRGVIVFRELDLDDRQQVAFVKTLGEVFDQGKNNIMKVSLDPNETVRADILHGTFFWHVDNIDDVPVRGTLLSARRLSDTGGQTDWSNTYAAYDDLPQPDKDEIASLRVVHSQERIQRMAGHLSHAEIDQLLADRAPKSQPLVWTHTSGRKSLLLGYTASHIEGMDPDEGRALLDRLQAWSTQPHYVYRHQWTVGDLAIWDNTGTMHRVTRYAADSGRLMHRTTLLAEESVA